MTELTEYITRRHQMTLVVVFALLASVVVYFLVAFVLGQMGGASIESALAYQKLRRIAYGFAFVYSIGLILFRRAMLGSDRLARVVTTRGVRGLVDHLSTVTILLAALGEVVAIIGLIMSLLSRVMEDMVRLGGVGALLILYNFPRRSKWFHLVEAYQTATGVTE